MADENQTKPNLLMAALRDSGIAGVGAEIGEAVVDSFLQNDFVKTIPILNTAIALVKGGMSVQNALFAEKVRRFLFETDKISVEQRSEFIRKLQTDRVYAGQVGQAALLAIDRADDFGKAAIHGAIFAAYVRGRIDLLDLRRLQNAVNAVPAPDLLSFIENKRDRRSVDPGDYTVFAAGLLFPYLTDVNNLVPNGDFSGGHVKFLVSNLGKLLIDLVQGHDNNVSS
jgi:hypothetical protein